MAWNLVIDKGEYKGKTIPIRLTPFVIGRDDDCQLRPASLYVSHRHCVLIRRDDSLALRDCHSTNGTLVNGRRVEGEVKLRPGDRIGIGPLAFVVSLKGSAGVNQEPKKSPSPHMPRIVSEEAIAALLLEMDNEEAAGKNHPHAENPPFSASEGDPAKTPGSASLEATPEQARLSPAEVAAALLRKKSFDWLRPKASNRPGSE